MLGWSKWANETFETPGSLWINDVISPPISLNRIALTRHAWERYSRYNPNAIGFQKYMLESHVKKTNTATEQVGYIPAPVSDRRARG